MFWFLSINLLAFVAVAVAKAVAAVAGVSTVSTIAFIAIVDGGILYLTDSTAASCSGVLWVHKVSVVSSKMGSAVGSWLSVSASGEFKSVSIRKGSLEKRWLVFLNNMLDWGGGLSVFIGILVVVTIAVLNLVFIGNAATSSTVELLNVEWDFVGGLLGSSILDSLTRLLQIVVSEIVVLVLVAAWFFINWLFLGSVFLNAVSPVI